jgi:hypothetical protein
MTLDSETDTMPIAIVHSAVAPLDFIQYRKGYSVGILGPFSSQFYFKYTVLRWQAEAATVA